MAKFDEEEKELWEKAIREQRNYCNLQNIGENFNKRESVQNRKFRIYGNLLRQGKKYIFQEFSSSERLIGFSKKTSHAFSPGTGILNNTHKV